MLRINLLPSYVQQRRLTKRLVLPFVLLFLACLAAPLAAYFYLHGKLVTLTQNADDAVTGKGKTDALKAEATTTIAQVGPIQQKLQFVIDVDAYARKWISKYNTLAETTPQSSFLYTGASITGPTMAIKAYSPSVEEVGRYLQVMYHEPDFSTVAVDHIPAYPENIRHLYYLDGVLVFADGATGGVGNSGGSPGGGGGRSPGGYPGAGGGQGGGFQGGSFQGGGGQAAAGGPANWNPDALGPNGATNVPPGVGPPPPEIAVGGTGGGAAGGGGRQGGFGGGGFGGGQFAGGQGGGGQTGTYSADFLRIAGRNISPFASPQVRDQIYQKALRRVVIKTVPKGFDINVTATLKEPLTPPSLPGTAPAGGTSPGGYPGGAPGGGYPGAPGGGAPGGGYPGAPGGGAPTGPPSGPPGRSA